MKNSDYYLAFILGDKALLSSDIYNAYQKKNGISHLLAISGMHINMLVLLISKIIKSEKKRICCNIIIFITIFIFNRNNRINNACYFILYIEKNK